jgi:hypothetical protein
MKKKAYLLLSESDQGGVNNLHSSINLYATQQRANY